MKVNIENFEQWNEQMAIKYNPDRYHNNPNFFVRFIERLRVYYILKFLNVQNGDEILDLGCGAGNILGKIKQGVLTGVDISNFLLGIAKQRKYHCPVNFIKANIEELPLEIKNKKYDKIICSEVLEHVLNPEKVIQEIAAVAKPESIVVITIPNEKLINSIKKIFINLGVFNLFFKDIPKRMIDEWHLREINLKDLDKLTNKYLVRRKTKSSPFFFLPIRYIIQFSIKSDS